MPDVSKLITLYRFCFVFVLFWLMAARLFWYFIGLTHWLTGHVIGIRFVSSLNFLDIFSSKCKLNYLPEHINKRCSLKGLVDPHTNFTTMESSHSINPDDSRNYPHRQSGFLSLPQCSRLDLSYSYKRHYQLRNAANLVGWVRSIGMFRQRTQTSI